MTFRTTHFILTSSSEISPDMLKYICVSHWNKDTWFALNMIHWSWRTSGDSCDSGMLSRTSVFCVFTWSWDRVIAPNPKALQIHRSPSSQSSHQNWKQSVASQSLSRAMAQMHSGKPAWCFAAVYRLEAPHQ